MTIQNDGMATGMFSDPEYIAEIQQAIREADAGVFATDAEVAAVRAKWHLDLEHRGRKADIKTPRQRSDG